MKDVPASESAPARESGSGRFAASCYEWMEALIISLSVVMLLFVFLFRVNIIVDGDSMLPNFENGNRVLVSCLDRSLRQGDVVVVDEHATGLKERLIKRVVATGGQTVDIDFQTGIVSVDGRELDESAYIRNGITKDQYDVAFPQKVPPGQLFVLGDNRTVSEDSRFGEVGMIDSRYVVGQVIFMLNPFGKIAE